MKLINREDPHFFCYETTTGYYTHPVMHRHEFHEFYFFLEGSGEQLTPRHHVPMALDDLYFFPAGQAHISNGPKEGICLGSVLYLSTYLFSTSMDGDHDAHRMIKWLAQRAERGENLIRLTPGGRAQLRTLFRAMATEFHRKEPGFKCIVKARILEMLFTIMRDEAMQPALQTVFRPAGSRERLDDVYHFLHMHYMKPLTITEVAEIAHMSRSHFHAVFKEETGHTFTEYLNDLRANAASILLQESDLSILEIASQCGFPCVSHFYHVFRTQFGMTPREMRQHARG